MLIFLVLWLYSLTTKNPGITHHPTQNQHLEFALVCYCALLWLRMAERSGTYTQRLIWSQQCALPSSHRQHISTGSGPGCFLNDFSKHRPPSSNPIIRPLCQQDAAFFFCRAAPRGWLADVASHRAPGEAFLWLRPPGVGLPELGDSVSHWDGGARGE